MPVVNIYATKDTTLMSNGSYFTNPGDGITIGRDSGIYYRGLIYFDLASVMGKQITEASLRLWHRSDYSTDGTPIATPFRVHRVTQDWNESAVRWSTQPSFAETGALDFSCPTGAGVWRHFNVTSLIQDIVHNQQTYYGLLLRQPGSESRTGKNFASRESYEGTSGDPILAVWFRGGFRVRADGSWRDGDTYVRDEGIWKPGTVYTRVDGTWRQGI